MKPLALLCLIAASALPMQPALAASAFNLGNLVVSVEGNGVQGAKSGPYTDNQAAPLTLFEFSHSGTSSATYVDALVLPATISGEYGSSSEGLIQRSADGRYLTLMGYGVNAAAFNANPTAYGTALNDPTKPNALGQSGSMTGQGYVPVARVVALIDGNGAVDTSTSLYNVFSGNNPRSVATVDGSAFYVSGQGHSPDATAGVFYATKGASAATAITGLDTNSKTSSQDTRVVEIYNNQLYVSVDSKAGSGSNRDFIGTLGGLPTGLYDNGAGPTRLPGYGNSGGTGKLVITAQTFNGVNAIGSEINLSPESFWFATDTIMYVADSGAPKNNSAGSKLGDGGLQKWIFSNGAWNLAYTLSAGLNLVANNAASGTTGLLGLTGQVDGGWAQLFATSYTVGDTDQTYLYGITDDLFATTRPVGETFNVLAAAPADSNFKGVAFAPTGGSVPEPQVWVLMTLGFGFLGGVIRRRRAAGLAAAAA